MNRDMLHFTWSCVSCMGSTPLQSVTLDYTRRPTYIELPFKCMVTWDVGAAYASSNSIRYCLLNEIIQGFIRLVSWQAMSKMWVENHSQSLLLFTQNLHNQRLCQLSNLHKKLKNLRGLSAYCPVCAYECLPWSLVFGNQCELIREWLYKEW